MQEGLAAANISDSELGRLQEKQRAAVQRSLGRASGGKARATYEDDDEFTQRRSSSSLVHPDLQELSFGNLGAEQKYAECSTFHPSRD